MPFTILLVNKKTIGAPVCVLSATNIVHDGKCTNPYTVSTRDEAELRKRSIIARAANKGDDWSDARCKNIVRRFTMFVVPTEEPKTNAPPIALQPVLSQARLFKAEPD